MTALRFAFFVLLGLCAACASCASSNRGPGDKGGAGDKPGDKSSKPGAMGGPAMAFAVETAEVKVEPVSFSTTAVGSLDAFERVLVTARVAGVVDSVHFREGDEVKAGQVLADIETERYGLAARAARAQLERARAAMADAKAALDRREAAEKQNPGLVRGEEIETYRTKLDTAAADVQIAQVAVDQAAVNQRDAQLRAPMGGVIQTRDIRTGQYAQPGTLVATLLKRDPLLLRFSVPEPDAAALHPGATVQLSIGGAPPREARITHVAGAADANTRMVPVIAEVPDPQGELRPGAFAAVTVPLGAARDAPVVPQSAIRPSERGFLAYIADGTKARERVVRLGQRTPDGRVEVVDGLKGGDQLIVRGAEALREGADIRMPGSAPPSAPLESRGPAGGPP